MKKFLRITGIVLMALLVLSLSGFFIWASTPAAPDSKALQSLNDTPEVTFTITNDWLVYTPADQNPETGLILYPGGRVDPRAYGPHAQGIAADGFKVIIVPMPLNFAFLGINRASQVIAAFPEIDQWAVGGHSLGGAMAVEFAKDNSQSVDGLVLWASYPAENTDLSTLELKTISIYATNDGLASPEEVLSAQPRLPKGTEFTEITGGNHAGFGWYGSQNGDGDLEISKQEQQNQVVDATVGLLSKLEEGLGNQQ